MTTKGVRQILLFLKKKTSDQISSISFTKGSDIVKLFISFLLRFPFNIASPPYRTRSESKSRFHLLWFSGSRYFWIHVALRDLLKN